MGPGNRHPFQNIEENPDVVVVPPAVGMPDRDVHGQVNVVGQAGFPGDGRQLPDRPRRGNGSAFEKSNSISSTIPTSRRTLGT